MTFVDPEAKLTVDLRLYAIVDPETAGGHALPDLARMVAAGGATLVQLRDKIHDTAAMVALARAIKAALPADVPLLVNDRVDVAQAAGADGVHLGQEDMSVVKARELLGPGPFIGLSIKTVEQARAAPLGAIDYVGIGGVFATTSKDQKSAPIGPAGLARIVKVFRERIGNFPTCGIAGITASNAEQVIAAGADGVSVISALSRAADPTAAARELRAIVDAARAKYAPTPPAVGAGGHNAGNA
ncbi:MAG TPA: thiamine phosphate synthase [Xanthobacteraceae bacterium]|nr:thiamine phosphate synthase [Xanthobacteraceae bacterium]